MGWPRGRSRKEYFAQKKAAEAAAKEVMPDSEASLRDQHNAQPASQPEVRAQPRTSVPPTRRVIRETAGGEVRHQVSDAGRVAYASMKAGPKRPDWQMKAGNNWESGVSAAEATGILNIPKEVYPEGMDFQWGTRSIRGQEQPQIRNGYRKSGWTEVHVDDFQGSPFWEFAQSRWAQDEGGFIVFEACILLARPEEFSIAERNQADRTAKEQLEIREKALTGGGMMSDKGVTGADDPSALRFNKIRRTVERLEIPKD